MTEDIITSLPTELGWGLIIALLVRGLVASIPRIVDSVTRGMSERATAMRLAEQVRLTQAESDRDDSHERRSLSERVSMLDKRIREQEQSCSEEIASAHKMHAITSERLTVVEAQHIKCERKLEHQAMEMTELRASISAMR